MVVTIDTISQNNLPMRWRCDSCNVPLSGKTAKVKSYNYMNHCKRETKKVLFRKAELQKSLSVTQNRVQFSSKMVR